MRIVYVTDGFPYPLTSGLLRHFHFIRELSRRHSVTLLSLVEREIAPEQREGVRPFTTDTLTFPFEPRPASFTRRALRRLLRRNPYDSAVERLGQTLRRLDREQEIDVLVHSGSRTTGGLKYVDGTPVVADLCDSTWVRLRSRLPTLQLRQWPRALLYHAHARGVEKHLLRRADHAVLAAPRDLEALGAEAAGKASVVANGVDLDYWRRRTPTRGSDTIVLTGAMHYRPNVDAAVHLIEMILPAVQREVPEARLLVVGRDPAPALRALSQRPGVTVTGFVEDMRPFLEQATVFAAPIRIGAGIQNKVLEAMAMELPIVASPIAADGLRTEAGDAPPISVAVNPGEFARELVAKLRAGRMDSSPCPEVRRYVERHFLWATSGIALEQVLTRTIAGRRRLVAGEAA